MRRAVFASLVLCACSSPPRETLRPAPQCTLDALPLGPLTAHGRTLQDADGRTVALRGLNAGGRAKFAPYAPFDFAPGDYDHPLGVYLDTAKSLGVDVLRVPFTWAAVEPTRGRYDEAFLTRYDALLDAAAARGLYTVVDFHQDVYSESLCGDGFPAWTIPDAGPAHHDCPSWFFAYGNADVKAAFDAFWSNDAGTVDANLALWDMLAARHANRAGVIGFELFNEPSPGSADSDAWEATTLPRYYEQAGQRVLAKAPHALVFADAPGVEAVTQTTQIHPPAQLGGALVFAPHYYDAAVLISSSPMGADVAGALKRWDAIGEQWNVPVFVGELGAPPAADGAAAYLASHYDVFDRTPLGGAVWEYSVAIESWNSEALSIGKADGGLYPEVAGAIARPFASRLAGTLRAQSFDGTTYRLDYDATAGGVTELRVPTRRYGATASVTVQATGGVCVDLHDGVVLVKASEAGATSISIP